MPTHARISGVPRSSFADAARTRDAIVQRAMLVASTEGLEGVTFGRLATDLEMSKAGVVGHFGTKEALQLAALERASEVFTKEVWEPAAAAAPGRARLVAIAEAWTSYLRRRVFPGGCFLTAASCEFDDREGPVRDAVAAAWRRWHDVLVREARADPELAPRAEQIAFDFLAMAQGANQALQLLGDETAPRRALDGMRRALG
ncbi:MAG: TetR/AcrR family transcriptional regulator [Solirubrobacterales bacterium]|nr:TetR/AcrR family transcriptional regulator [Solirubrobacterales bacterium]